MERELVRIMPLCLESSEYFALLGAAQLNNGNISGSLESLERALLLEPRNGAAQVDYAQALFLQGDLFAAIELNNQLLEREDVPNNLLPLLEQRQANWVTFTQQRTLRVDLLAGYDSNLNTAPESSQVTLTLSGEPVVLELNPEFQPISGPYLNFKLDGQLNQLRPGYQHNWRFEANGRVSEEKESDLLQMHLGYGYIRPRRNNSWQVNSGLTHLLFGGKSLYTASEGIVRYQPGSNFRCDPYYDLALQHQLFHDRSELNALEGKIGAGLACPFRSTSVSHQLIFDLGLLGNYALDKSRPGDDRNGWQANLIWRLNAGDSEFLGQLSYTEIDDDETYNPILANGARRTIERGYVLFQYRRTLSDQLSFLMNLFYQEQSSNIELFTNTDTSVELGISFTF